MNKKGLSTFGWFLIIVCLLFVGWFITNNIYIKYNFINLNRNYYCDNNLIKIKQNSYTDYSAEKECNLKCQFTDNYKNFYKNKNNIYCELNNPICECKTTIYSYKIYPLLK